MREASCHAYLVEKFGRHRPSGVQSGMQVKLLDHLAHITHDHQAEERAGKPTAVAEDADALALELLAADVAEQADEAAVHAGAVHVAAHGRDLDAGLDALLESFLAKGHEALLDRFVGEGLLVAEVADLGGDGFEGWVGGRGGVIVVEHARVGFRDEFAGRGMEDYVIEAVEGGVGVFRLGMGAVAVDVAVGCGLLQR